MNLLLWFAYFITYTKKHNTLSFSYSRNVPGPCNLFSCQSQQLFQTFFLLLNHILTAHIHLEGKWWEMSYGLTHVLHEEENLEFLLLLVTWGYSINSYLPGKLCLWMSSSSLDFWATPPKYFNLHFLRLNSNFIYWLCFYAQRRLFCILCTIQLGMFLVTEHLSFELASECYPNVQQVSLTKGKKILLGTAATWIESKLQFLVLSSLTQQQMKWSQHNHFK